MATTSSARSMQSGATTASAMSGSFSSVWYFYSWRTTVKHAHSGGRAPCAGQGQEKTRKATVTSKEKTGKAGKGGKVRNGKDQGRGLATTLEQDGQGGKEEVRKGNDKAKDKGTEVATMEWFWKTRAHSR